MERAVRRRGDSHPDASCATIEAVKREEMISWRPCFHGPASESAISTSFFPRRPALSSTHPTRTASRKVMYIWQHEKTGALDHELVYQQEVPFETAVAWAQEHAPTRNVERIHVKHARAKKAAGRKPGPKPAAKRGPAKKSAARKTAPAKRAAGAKGRGRKTARARAAK